MHHKPILMLLLAVASVVEAFGQQPAARPGMKLVAVGEIRNVNKVKRTFELRSQKYSNGTRDRSSGEEIIGISIGRGSPPPINDPFPDPTRGLPRTFPGDDPLTSIPDPDQFPSFITTKVFMTDSTVCKEGDKVILCGDIKTSDSVRVTGEEKNSDPRGKGLYASEVVRMPK